MYYNFQYTTHSNEISHQHLYHPDITSVVECVLKINYRLSIVRDNSISYQQMWNGVKTCVVWSVLSLNVQCFTVLPVCFALI